MLNKVILIGRITKDPELKTSSSGLSYVNFTLAVNRNYTSQSGERQADFLNCIAWRKTAEFLGQYVRKGMQIFVEGSIRTSKFESNGMTRYSVDIHVDTVQFAEAKSENRNNNVDSNNYDNEAIPSNDDEYYNASAKLAAEDDLPF